MSEIFDLVIIGSGPSGLTAAIYGVRANKKVALITGDLIGGQLTKTTEVENYPGFALPIMGPDLMEAMYEQAKNQGVIMIENLADKIEKIDDIFNIQTGSEFIKSRSVVIATGANPKLLGIEGHLYGYGISTCATCDGSFFKNKIVAVIGGGNSALEEALYLSNLAQKVFLIHRRSEFRGEAVMQDRVFEKAKNGNIEIMWPYKVNKFIGEKVLEAIELQNTETDEIMTLQASGAFVAIGHTPNTQFLKDLLDLDENGYIKEKINTKIPGLFVAGDVFDDRYRQAVTAAGFGCMAAIEALHYLLKSPSLS